MRTQHLQTDTLLNTLNRNLLRIASQPARRVVNNNDQPQQQAQQQQPQQQAQAPPASLSPTPRSLHISWHEHEFDMGGRKPAREFAAQESGRAKHSHHKRKAVWDQTSLIIRAGCAAQTACDFVCEVCGVSLTITQLIDRMRRDRNNGGHPALRAVVWCCMHSSNCLKICLYFF